ncbi:hypothetical protein LRH25_28895 [Ideonella azotifigens]|uniref:hypothetical protein n=2 Tax=Ideonella azotifigens TaxID=513160 RepID=UPI001E49EFF2|nr:hypothetical protein [Ideonella azotifigens]MCD2344346.1 hypothetical protein [Ideonella azotifigens]
MRCTSAGLAVLLLLAGCVGTPPAVPPAEGGGIAVLPDALTVFESAQRQRAQELERKEQLADAAWAWEVLATLRPGEAEYRERVAALRRRIDTAVAERLQRGQQAQKRGDLEAASTQYLAALALQPQPAQAAQAADALRAIERERNRRNFLGQPSRITIARRNPAEFLQPVTPAAPGRADNAAPDRNELEHITMLAAQGELDEALALAEQRVAADRRDAAARQLLVDLYVQKAEQLAAREQKPEAIAWLQKSLKLPGNHARATALMKQLKPAAPVAAGAVPAKAADAARSAGTAVGTAISSPPDAAPVDR